MSELNTQEKDGLHILRDLPKPKRDVLIPLEQLKTDPHIQIRFKPGQNTFGFVTKFNSTHVEALKSRIIDAGGVLVPLTVWKTGDKEYTIIRGNTRWEACCELINDPECPQGLIDAIKKLKCEVYEGITKEQAIALVNDQDQQRYNKADFVNLCWKLAAEGVSYYNIAFQYTDMYADYVGTVQAKNKLAEYRSMKGSLDVKLKYLKDWARGALDQGILLARLLGERVQKAFLLKVADMSGMLSSEDEHAEFNPMKGSRLKDLKKAVADASAFNALIDQYIKEDAGEIAVEQKGRPSVSALTNLKMGVKSDAFKTAYAVAMGEKPGNADASDMMAYRNETIMKTLEQLLPSVKNPEIAELIATIIRSQNPVELSTKLAKYTA